jgi:hypothetical protein
MEKFCVQSATFEKMDRAMNDTTDEPELPEETFSGTRDRLLFWFVIVAISALVLLYAVTRAFVWDEGYHLIAAQQISQGRLPYIDFCFPQTPLNAYVNASVVKVYGQHWRPVHVVATLFSLGSMLLTVQYLLTSFPARRWRLACAITAAIFVGLNEVVFQFGTIGQAYGICLFFSVAAFRVALSTPGSLSVLPSLGCGMLAGVAAGSSLLTAPMLPALLIWILVYDRVAIPWRKALAFIAGNGIAFLPMVWLFVLGSKQTLFNIVQYHALYRRADWPGATYHDLRVFTSWLDSTQALTLVLLAAAGVVFLLKYSDWPRPERAEFYLAAWISIAEGAYLCTPHPTFGRYFIFLTPFMTILSMAGLYSLGSKMGYAERPAWPAGLAAVFMALMFSSFGVACFDDVTWRDYEKVAQKIVDVTPRGGRIFADEVVYFALQQSPPSGMEVSYTHAVTLPPEQGKLMHIVSLAELKDQFARHEFATVQSCSDDEEERYGLPGPYRYRADMNDCTVYWGERPK